MILFYTFVIIPELVSYSTCNVDVYYCEVGCNKHTFYFTENLFCEAKR